LDEVGHLAGPWLLGAKQWEMDGLLELGFWLGFWLDFTGWNGKVWKADDFLFIFYSFLIQKHPATDAQTLSIP
jgi:hypothetical protein